MKRTLILLVIVASFACKKSADNCAADGCSSNFKKSDCTAPCYWNSNYRLTGMSSSGTSTVYSYTDEGKCSCEPPPAPPAAPEKVSVSSTNVASLSDVKSCFTVGETFYFTSFYQVYKYENGTATIIPLTISTYTSDGIHTKLDAKVNGENFTYADNAFYSSISTAAGDAKGDLLSYNPNSNYWSQKTYFPDNIPLIVNFISFKNSIYVTDDNRNLYTYDKSGSSWKSLNKKTPFNTISSISKYADHSVLCTDSGVFKQVEQNFELINSTPYIKCVTDKKGVLFAVNGSKNLQVLSNTTDDVYQVAMDYFRYLNVSFNDVEVDPDGKIYVISDNNLFYIDNYVLYEMDLPFTNPYKKIFIDEKGNVFLCTEGAVYLIKK